MGSKSVDQFGERARQPGPQRRRPQVLDTALEIAVSEGSTAVTMAAVAERMRVTRPVVDSCFADRDEMVRALYRREEQYFVGRLLCALPYGGLGEDETALAGSLCELLRLCAERPQGWQLLTGAVEPMITEREDCGGAVIRQRCAAVLEGSLREWGARAAERKAPMLAEQWLAAGRDAVRTLLDEPDDWTAEELAGVVGAGVYRMIRQA